MAAQTQAALEDDIGVLSAFTVMGNSVEARAGLKERMTSLNIRLSNPDIVSSNRCLSDRLPIRFLGLELYGDDRFRDEVWD